MKKSLGTISALAALCASSQTSEGAVMTSTTIDNSVVVSNSGDPSSPISIGFDFNNDAITDFLITSPSNDSTLLIAPQNGNSLVIENGTGFLKTLQVGDVVSSGTQFYSNSTQILFDSSNAAASVIEEGSLYFGIHYPGPSGFLEAWVRLDVALNGGAYNESGDSIIATTSQWESTQNGSITIVPEPSSGALAMAGIASMSFLRRRRKS